VQEKFFLSDRTREPHSTRVENEGPKAGRKLLGHQLTIMRQAAGLSEGELADKLKCSRAWIYDVEAGRKNFTINEYDRLIQGCGTSTEQALAGLNTSDVPTEFHDLYWNLRTIIMTDNKDLIFGIRVNLDAISEKARNLKKARTPKPRPRSPTPEPGEAAEGDRDHLLTKSSGKRPARKKSA